MELSLHTMCGPASSLRMRRVSCPSGGCSNLQIQLLHGAGRAVLPDEDAGLLVRCHLNHQGLVCPLHWKCPSGHGVENRIVRQSKNLINFRNLSNLIPTISVNRDGNTVAVLRR